MRTSQRHDWDLLRQYARQGTQAAFDEIVRRHIKLVYATCRRELGDEGLAEDVTQVVFLILSRKAGLLPPGTILSRWLFKTARFASKDVRKREARRRAREEHLHDQEARSVTSTPAVSALDSALLSALGSLGRGDWEALQWRFYEEMSLKEIGEAYGISEDAAQKRVARAVDRVRRAIAQEGINLTVVTVATLIGAENFQAAPHSCLRIIEHASTISASVHSVSLAGQSKVYGLTKGVLTAMAFKNITATAIVLGVALAAGIPAIVQGEGNTAAQKTTPAAAPSVNGEDLQPLAATVVIDPGHGGADSGSHSTTVVGPTEKELNLMLALKLRDALIARGAQVYLTRDSDAAPSVSDRARFAVKQHADYFLSLHCDDSGAPNSHSGATVYYHAQNKAAHLLATSILDNIARQAVLPSLGTKSDRTRFPQGFGVLRGGPEKSVLIECGYINNDSDLAAIRDPEKQARIVRGIADGVAEAAANQK